MATGGGEQSSRDDCKEKCRRQTISPPDPEITLRSMISWSSVTQPAGRDVGSAYQIETPPASPQYRDVNATELEHCRQRGANLTLRVWETCLTITMTIRIADHQTWTETTSA